MQQFDNEFFMTFTKVASRLYVWHIFIKKPPCMGGFVLYSFEKGIFIVQYTSVQSHYRECQLDRL